MIQIDPNYVPAPIEHKDVFGIQFEQGRNELVIDDALFANVVTENKEIPEAAKRDLAISMITLKYTQSNSVCYVKDGQAIGIGAGQQSRIHCTRLAGTKADNWFLRSEPAGIRAAVCRRNQTCGQRQRNRSVYRRRLYGCSGRRSMGEYLQSKTGSIHKRRKREHGWIR